MNEENMVCGHRGALFSSKEKWNYLIYRKAELVIVMWSEISCTREDKYCMSSQNVESKIDDQEIEGKLLFDNKIKRCKKGDGVWKKELLII